MPQLHDDTYEVQAPAYCQKKLNGVTFELSPKCELVLASLAIIKHVPETFVGTLIMPLLIEQPEAVPFVTV